MAQFNKNWLIISTVSFSIGCGLSLAIDRDIRRAALTGLISVPPAIVGATIVERRFRLQGRKEQLLLQAKLEEVEQRKTEISALVLLLRQLQTDITTQQSQNQDLSGLEAQKQSLEQESQALKDQIKNLRQVEACLNESLANTIAQQKKAENRLLQQNTDLEQPDKQILDQQQEKKELNQSLICLEQQKQQMEVELSSLQSKIQSLEQQVIAAVQTLQIVTTQKQQMEQSVVDSQSEWKQLQNQISLQQQQKENLCQERTTLILQKDELVAEITQLQLHKEINNSRQPLASTRLNQPELSESHIGSENNGSIKVPQHIILAQVSETGTHHHNNSGTSFAKSQEIAPLLPISDRPTQNEVSPITMLAEVSEVETDQIGSNGTGTSETPVVTPTSPEPEVVVPVRRSRPKFPALRIGGGIDFSNPKQTRKFWESDLLPRWLHRDRPIGQRFLGSLWMLPEESDRLLDVVGDNLRKLRRFTPTSLYDNFYETEQNWLKILILALSEYAYYYSSEQFWQGFCERLKFRYAPEVEEMLCQLVNEGAAVLGLVRAKGELKGVSTLWMQSGMPQAYLSNFAQLVQVVVVQDGWRKLTLMSAEELSQVLFNLCQEQDPQWVGLMYFLGSSYAQGKAVEPISGQLVQGIARVAQELECRKLSPEVLQNEMRREELLRGYQRSPSFFLRNWDAVIQVLGHQA